MKEEQQRFLNLLGRLPCRLNAEQAAWVINCQTHDIPILIAARLLKPLGNPAQNAIKFFAASDVLELASDRSWLVKVTTAINAHWHRQNVARKPRVAVSDHSGSIEQAATMLAN